jgi:hypothetical protein
MIIGPGHIISDWRLSVYQFPAVGFIAAAITCFWFLLRFAEKQHPAVKRFGGRKDSR